MKKLLTSLVLTLVMFLSGCGLLEETQNTFNYATEATEYLNELSTFAEDIQSYLNDGNVNVEELEYTMTELEGVVKEFNTIEVPAIAEGIHENISVQNEKLLQTIDSIQENGDIAIKELQNTEIYQTIESITNFMDQVEQLGFE